MDASVSVVHIFSLSFGKNKRGIFKNQIKSFDSELDLVS